VSEALNDLIVGDSIAIRILRTTIAQVAPTTHRVLIHGPSGSGKELVAQALHLLSGRRGRFVPINVCAIPETMFEAMLFGHVRGAFTGATADSRGFLREADGGTAFFDEISSLPMNSQGKVLRGIETRAFRPVGAGADQSSDFRLISATNEHLGTLAQAGQFRADLLHRIGTILVRVPALSERTEDIPVLVSHFLGRSTPPNKPPIEVTSAAMHALQSYSWPGNVRQLRNVIECACTVAPSHVIDSSVVEEILRTQSWMISALRSEASVGRHPVQPGAFIGDSSSETRGHYIALLEAHGWRVEHTAHALGIHRATLSRHLRALGIDPRVCRRTSRLSAARGAACHARHDDMRMSHDDANGRATTDHFEQREVR
jgi:DNA-binding NtrC family response regulator